MRFVHLFLLLPSLLLGSAESFFEDEDPNFYHNVHVISGHLQFVFEDANLKSPVPYTVRRSYTSSGFLERARNNIDLVLPLLRKSKWMLQGGWTFLPEANFLIRPSYRCLRKDKGQLVDEGRSICCEVTLKDKSGNNLLYTCTKHDKSGVVLQPLVENNPSMRCVDPRKDLRNSYLKLHDTKSATLFLPDGGERHFTGKLAKNMVMGWWVLEKEILPSKHQIVFTYSGEERKPKTIEVKNPKGDKVFASITFNEAQFESENRLQAHTSDGASFSYALRQIKKRDYLVITETSLRPKEAMWYQPGRKGTGARFESFKLGGREKLQVTYFEPPNKKQASKWADDPKKVPFWADRIRTLSLPDPKTGELSQFATFSYEENRTIVEDYEGVTTDYFHDGKNLTRVVYYDSKKNMHSSVTFGWKDGRLAKKTLYDSGQVPIYSRSFSYDGSGNLLCEKLIDHQKNTTPLVKRFTYYPETHLVKTEEEEGGLSYEYTYLPGTDLVTEKITCFEESVLLRELTDYDKDNLPIRKVVDDGSSFGVTQKQIEEHERDPHTGLILETRKKYLDIGSGREVVLSTHRFAYSKEKNPVEEKVIFGKGGPSYVLKFEYDERGRLIKKTTPSGRMETFCYDEEGRPLEIKEVGRQKKQFEYDELGQAIVCTEGDKTSRSTYDRKGRLIEQVDRLGQKTLQKFDEFGHCTETVFPQALDENGIPYFPAIINTYDLMGNLTSYTNPKGETKQISYTILRKALTEVDPEGVETSHTYNSNGTLASTLYVNGTKAVYEYDPFQRLISKKVIFGEEVLSEENWKYSSFHLLSYTDPRGLTTLYEYNGAGQKVKEIAGDRVTTFSYDPMGNLERVTSGGFSKIQNYNLEGELIVAWEEGDGKQENWMQFFYDDEGRKIKAIRRTSQGEAEDQFFYDEKGRLILHIDPLKHTTEFIYQEIENSLGQLITQKTMIDPLGLSEIETYDANGRIVLIEKKDSDQKTISKEEFFYDRAGNKAKRVATIFKDHAEIRKHTTVWDYDQRGQVIREIEEDEKETLYSYDKMGHLVTKTLPSKIVLTHKYDPLGRLLAVQSSDQTLHYSYLYGKGAEVVEATDRIHGLHWERSHNEFGQLISEKRPNGSMLFWEYDDRGRTTQFTLPDTSFISYDYGDLHLEKVSRYSPIGNFIYGHTYTEFDENGHVAKEELIEGLGEVMTSHDLLERPKTQSTPWHTSSVRYGPSGLVTSYSNAFFKTKEFAYDSLNQLIQEGDKSFSFDSLGNPTKAKVNHLNQVMVKQDTHFTYDPNGNPIKAVRPGDQVCYTYDPFDRLSTITQPEKNRIHFIYDPFNRLYCKVKYEPEATYFYDPSFWSRDTHYYLYDKATEIGSVTYEDKIIDLKVVGLGILGEIGGTIAIEIKGEYYVPFHDFCGNVNLLISSHGKIIEKIEMDAFGKALNAPSINPWRFSSKRSEENLVFFGSRFYSPFLERFLTPDPAGSIDSPNLYLFVYNSPLNRLDLFGLSATDISAYDLRLEVPFSQIQSNLVCFNCNAYINGVQSDWLIYSTQLHKIQFTPEEIEKGVVNIRDHFTELVPKEGMMIGLSSFQNGVNNPFPEFKNSFVSTMEQIPGDTLGIGIYSPTKGVVSDIGNALLERAGIQTPEVCRTRQAFLAICESLNKVNPEALWLHIGHSRGGGIGYRAADGMTPEEQELMRNTVIWLGVAPSHPMANELVFSNYNFYSKHDGVTGLLGLSTKLDAQLASVVCFDWNLKGYGPWTRKLGGFKNYSYNIEFVPSCTSWKDRTMGLFDHAFLGDTYFTEATQQFRKLDKKYGFYGSEGLR